MDDTAQSPIMQLMEMMQKKSSLPTSERLRAMRNKMAPIIHDKVLRISSSNFSNDFDRTMVYAVLCNGYGEAEFEEDVQLVARRYGIKEDRLLRYMITGSDLVPDEDAAFRNIIAIVEKLNMGDTQQPPSDPLVAASLQGSVSLDPVKRLRIVEVGFKETRLIEDVLKYMMKNWISPSKFVQFIYIRNDDKLLMFWKKLCLHGGLEVEYVNREDYTAIGTLE